MPNEELTIDIDNITPAELKEQIKNYALIDQLNIFDNAAYEFYKVQEYELALSFWGYAKEYASTHQLFEQEIYFLKDIGTTHIELGQSLKGVEVLKQALELSQKHKTDEFLIDILFGLSQGYLQIDAKGDALNYARQALTQAKKINTYYEVCRAYMNLGNCNVAMLDFEDAKENYEKSLSFAKDGDVDENLTATIEMNIGNVHRHTLHLADALKHYEKAEAIYLKTGFEELYTLYINMSIVYTRLHLFDDAKSCLDASLNYYEQIGHHDNVASCLINLGRLEEERWDYKKAKELHQKALDIASSVEDIKYLKSTCYLNIANCCFVDDEVDESFEYYKASHKSAKEFDQKDIMASALKGIADVLHHKARYDEAEELYVQSIDAAKECGDVELLMASHIVLASLYSETGELKKSLDIYLETIEDAKKHSHTKYEISAIINIASLYLEFKDIDKSYEYLYDALDKAIEFEDKELEAKIYSNLANLFEINEQYEESKNFSKKSIEIKKELCKKTSLAFSYASMARCYEESDDVKSAKEYYEKAMGIFESLHDMKNYHMALANYGHFLHRFGIDMDKAQELQNKALAYFSQNRMSDALVSLYSNLGTIYESDDFKKAKVYFTKALEFHSAKDIPLYDENWNINIREDVAVIYEKLINIYLHLKCFIDAFNTIEDAKANTFLKKLEIFTKDDESRYEEVKRCL
jgi:tetratricopeptide (TPR) repeat protein